MGDLTVTAIYTSQTWRWGKLPDADLFDFPAGRIAFSLVNGFLGLAHLLVPGRPTLRHSLLQRHVLIDKLLKRSGSRQVLELASGLSRRGAAFSRDPGMSYTEVDLPAVIAAKRRLLARTPAGREVASRGNLRLLAGDVTQDSLDSFVDPEPGLFVIAEGLFTYLDAAAQRSLWQRVAALLHRGGTFAIDLVPASEQPPPGAVGRGLGRVMRLFTKGQGFVRDERSREDIVSELRAAGSSSVEVLEPRSLAREWELPYPNRLTQQLVFVATVTRA